MPWSHHSHSGQFCGHATSTLEEVVQTAIQKGMTTFCMTEHMPREEVDFYPEEADHHTEESLAKLFDDYYHEARRLQKAYADKIHIFVGFEGEWTRDSSATLIARLQNRYAMDLFVGSVHHVHTVPIDYDDITYRKARKLARHDTDESLFADYFEEQRKMLLTLKPPVVGHFDLIRLKSDDPERSFKTWPAIWKQMTENMKLIADYGGIMELNSASLRKGMSECYPQVEICAAFHEMGGRFTLSDDSHGVDQVGLNYHKVLDCAVRAGIQQLWHVEHAGAGNASLVGEGMQVSWKPVAIDDLKQHQFWKA